MFQKAKDYLERHRYGISKPIWKASRFDPVYVVDRKIKDFDKCKLFLKGFVIGKESEHCSKGPSTNIKNVEKKLQEERKVAIKEFKDKKDEYDRIACAKAIKDLVDLARQHGIDNLTNKCFDHQQQVCFFKARKYGSWYDEDGIKVGDIKVLSFLPGI
jgi:hypothetical protein